jgi:hypothetical protein
MDAIDRLRNLRRVDMTDEMDLPTAAEIMRRAQVRRQRRRVATAVVGLAASAAAIGAVIGIALRDDPDKVSTIDDLPRTTVTVVPTTTSTTSTTSTTTTTSTTAGPPSGTLKPPDSEFPAAGTCGGVPGPVTEAEMRDDVPAPRCLQVLADQKLRLTNGLGVPITVDFADFHTVIQPGQAYLFDRPVGEFLALGVHRMEITHDLPDANTTGPEIWLVEELGPQT